MHGCSHALPSAAIAVVARDSHIAPRGCETRKINEAREGGVRKKRGGKGGHGNTREFPPFSSSLLSCR